MLAALTAPFELVVRRWGVLIATTMSELRSMYAGSVLGLAWVVAGPVVLMILYAVMYGVIFKVQPQTMTFGQYVLFVMAGLVPFMSFSSSLTVGAQSLSKSKQILLNTFYPSELIGVRTVLVQTAQIVSGLAIAIVAALFIAKPGWVILLIPVVLICQVLFTCALVWLLSLLTLALRDLQHIIQYAMFALLLVTPIGYDRTLVPKVLQWMMYFNPLYYFVSAYQDIIVFGRVPDAVVIVVGLVGSIGSFVLAFAIFTRAKQVFYDYA